MGFFAPEKKERFISVRTAATAMGISTQAVYDAEKQRTIPAIREVVNNKERVKIPLSSFTEFLGLEREKLQKDLDRIKNAENMMRKL